MSRTATVENSDDEREKAGGQRQRSAVAPQPSIRDHHSRFREKLTAWNYVEVVVGSKLLDLFNIYLYYQRSRRDAPFRYSCPSLKPNIRHAVTHQNAFSVS